MKYHNFNVHSYKNSYIKVWAPDGNNIRVKSLTRAELYATKQNKFKS